MEEEREGTKKGGKREGKREKGRRKRKEGNEKRNEGIQIKHSYWTLSEGGQDALQGCVLKKTFSHVCGVQKHPVSI